ncbi:MAG: hypothetical protein Q9198_010728, partial [Flavoplaca austrocitrina]
QHGNAQEREVLHNGNELVDLDWLLEGVWAESPWKEGEIEIENKIKIEIEIEIEIEIATAIRIERA